ncbi:hypothetical protein [Nocardiopsis tropica]|uniref:Uncharacterized protein n=1 Tax=Nocardiopsis tropica TaxID=109330 RepID=A0ABU7KMY9_9ACTN|nr:hypothetical protein [Nocardiopsis umidischolae]MEE2050644.1 hypothetical protein [Nocardiopsis umidischolae]
MPWNIRPGTDGTLRFRRPWDEEEQTVPATPNVQAVLTSLEELDDHTPGWFFGFHPPSDVQRVEKVWAQIPGEVLVQSSSVDELRREIRQVRRQRNL